MNRAAHAHGVTRVQRKNPAWKNSGRFRQLVYVTQQFVIGDERNLDAGKRVGRDCFDDFVSFGWSNLDPRRFGVVVDKERHARYRLGDRLVVSVHFVIVVGIIIWRYNSDSVHAKVGRVLGQFDGGIGIGRADVHDDGDFSGNSLNDLLGHLLALVDLHNHALTVSA